jgi:hypothetical protein
VRPWWPTVAAVLRSVGRCVGGWWSGCSCGGTNFRCRVERPESDLVVIKVYRDIDYVTSPALSECLDEQLGSSPTGSGGEIGLIGDDVRR